MSPISPYGRRERRDLKERLRSAGVRKASSFVRTGFVRRLPCYWVTPKYFKAKALNSLSFLHAMLSWFGG